MKELLAPVGSMEALYAAVHNGADAVYLAGKSFGARAFAKNFSNEEIIEAINFAHLYGVKVYITVNTLIKDDEFNEVLEFIDFLYYNGVDAVIIQDVGLAHLINLKYPKLEMHASTQMHNLDTYSAKFLSELGFSRMVVARELSLDEINNIDTDLEIEGFIHGALCMSYSGVCLMSSMALKRSGNRGACAQLCRMPYHTNDDSGYLLSPKDVSTVTFFEDVMKSKIFSLKIEGRMKSPAYVAVVTKMYRKLIDGYYSNTKVDVSDELEKLDYLFNRGYSKGYIGSDKDIVNKKRPNHKGVEIGSVISCDEKRIKIKLSKTLNNGDGIKFENQDKGMNVFNIYLNNEQVKVANEGDVISIPNNVSLTDLDTVLKTSDILIESDVLKYDLKKIKIDVDISIVINSKIELTFNDGVNKVTKYGDIVSEAINKSVSIDDIKSKISKLGNTAYEIDKLNIKMDDNIFVSMSSINNLRRECVESLNELRTLVFREKGSIDIDYLDTSKNSDGLSVFVRKNDQLNIIRNYKVDRIYTNNYDLYINNKDINIYYEVNINDNHEFKDDKLLVNSTSDIIKYEKNDLILNYPLNIYNKWSTSYFSKELCLSPELTLDELSSFDSGETLLYGRVRVMMTKHCLFSNKCSNCVDKYLIDSFKNKYSIECINGITYIYDYKSIDYLMNINELNHLGHRIDFFDESTLVVKEVMERYFKNLKDS